MELKDKYDVVIIGGGISGLGVLLEASLNAFDALLIERAEICRATSDNSLRIIHGGVRYLQDFDFKRLRESVLAQQELIDDFPGAIEPLRCVMPLPNVGLKRAPIAALGAKAYRFLSKRYTGKPADVSVMSPAQVHELAPFLDAPHGAFSWHDALMLDPAEVVTAVKDKACACGGSLIERAEPRAIDRTAQGFGVQVQWQGTTRVISARTVVNAAGPWYQSVGKKMRNAQLAPTIGWCRAFNVIVKRAMRERLALGVENAEGRLYFAVPRGQHSALGTQYLPHSGGPEDLKVSDAEIETFLKAFHQALPAIDCARKDVVKVEVGLLPVYPQKLHASDNLDMVKQELVLDYEGFVDVISTKYTTFRMQARKVIQALRPYIVK